MLVCAFSPDGSYIVAGANDCHCHVWSWDALKHLSPPPLPGGTSPREAPDESAVRMEAVRKVPAPALITRAPGHTKGIVLLQFSCDGSAFATGSRDETLRVRAHLGLWKICSCDQQNLGRQREVVEPQGSSSTSACKHQDLPVRIGGGGDCSQAQKLLAVFLTPHAATCKRRGKGGPDLEKVFPGIGRHISRVGNQLTCT